MESPTPEKILAFVAVAVIVFTGAAAMAAPTGHTTRGVRPSGDSFSKNTGSQTHELHPFAPAELAYRPGRGGRFYGYYGR